MKPSSVRRVVQKHFEMCYASQGTIKPTESKMRCEHAIPIVQAVVFVFLLPLVQVVEEFNLGYVFLDFILGMPVVHMRSD